MKLSLLSEKFFGRFASVLFISLTFHGCAMRWGTDIQWNSQSQILMSEARQVKLRSIQTRVLDTTDRAKIMRAAISTMQDLFFDIDVLDEDLGVVSGKKLFNNDNSWGNNPTYYLYNTDELIIFNTNFRTWGPFNYRNDLIRITVTIRPREKTQSLVRASIQHNIRAIEARYIYQQFFKFLGQSLFLSAKME